MARHRAVVSIRTSLRNSTSKQIRPAPCPAAVWADDLQLLVDGKPVWDAPKAVRPKTAIDVDLEFDAGSRIAVSELTKVQIENLATLGRVWGFLKYHHPDVVAGKRHWDYELR